MKQSRRKFSEAFKAQVAIEALKERDSLSDLAKRFDVQPLLNTRWKKEFVERSSEIFRPEPRNKNIKTKKIVSIQRSDGSKWRITFKKVSKRLGL